VGGQLGLRLRPLATLWLRLALALALALLGVVGREAAPREDRLHPFVRETGGDQGKEKGTS
jgi:hypothetical protein